jgi:hypothetical protein
MRPNILTVSWFSAGVSSAVATWLMRDQIDRIIYIHIEDQEADTLRFVKDVEAWIGKPIEILYPAYRNVGNVIRAVRFINGPNGAACSRLLKRRVRSEWECENRFFNTFRYAWGMDADEVKRAELLRDSSNESEHEFPLIDAGIDKAESHGILAKHGVKRPHMYDLGFPNNNCKMCVKGGAGYMNRCRECFPAEFAERAKQEREIGHSCLNGTYLDELDPKAGRDLKIIVPECGAMCHVAEDATQERKEGDGG